MQIYGQNYTGPEGGMALVVVIVFTAALLLLATGLAGYMASEMLIASYVTRDVRLYYLTEAGLEAGLAALCCDFARVEGITGSLNGGSFSVEFTGGPTEQRNIVTQGALDGAVREMVVVVEERGPGQVPAILRWTRPLPLH